MLARHARAAREAADAAADLGFPVVLNVLSEDILHKTDIGGVRLGVADCSTAEMAFDEVLAASRTAQPNATLDGCLAAPVVTGGVETLLGVQRDPEFGPSVMFGFGGSSRLPFDEAEARAMFESAAAYPHPTGLRSQPPADLDTLASAFSRFAAVNADTIESLHINSFLVRPTGALALNAVLVTRSNAP